MLSSPTLDRLYKYVLDTPVHTWIDCSCAPHAPSQSSTKKTLLNLPTFLFGQNEQQNRRCGHDVHEILIHNLHPSSTEHLITIICRSNSTHHPRPSLSISDLQPLWSARGHREHRSPFTATILSDSNHWNSQWHQITSNDPMTECSCHVAQCVKEVFPLVNTFFTSLFHPVTALHSKCPSPFCPFVFCKSFCLDVVMEALPYR